METIKSKIRPYIPFTVLNTVWRHIGPETGTILDVGCGKGEPAMFINRNGGYFTIGLDAFDPYLKHCKTCGIHDTYIQADVRSLPFTDNSFDSVICLEVLEHLEKEDGE